MIPPKHFGIFLPLTGECSEGLDAFRFFFKLSIPAYYGYPLAEIPGVIPGVLSTVEVPI